MVAGVQSSMPNFLSIVLVYASCEMKIFLFGRSSDIESQEPLHLTQFLELESAAQGISNLLSSLCRLGSHDEVVDVTNQESILILVIEQAKIG